MILHRYFARRFLQSFLAVMLSLAVLIGLIDLVDELNDFPDLSFGDVLEIVFLKLPQSNYEIVPMVTILASVALFLRLARSSELVVLRAAGRSGLRGLTAPVLVVLVIGLIWLGIGNPIVAATAKRYNDLVNSYSHGGSSVLALSPEGLWLRQGDSEGQTVIHASRASSDLQILFDATFVEFSTDGKPLRRIAAREARLEQGMWQLQNAKVWELRQGINPEATAKVATVLDVPSDLTRDRIADSFGKPQYIPIWELPKFISELESAGFSARRYAIWYQTELAGPVFLVALLIISAAFTMRPARGTNAGISVMAAVLLGFGLYYIRNFSAIMGENGQIPILLAAWAPPVASLLLGIGILLHMEDG